MNTKALNTLEFNKIKQKLIDYTISSMGKEIANKLVPVTSISEIERLQAETTDATSMTFRKGRLPLGSLKDMRASIKRANMGGTLTIEELLYIGDLLRISRQVKNYSKDDRKNEIYESIDSLFDLIQTALKLENEINRCILSEQEISDDASNNLRTIRQEIKSSNNKIREQLNSIIHSSSNKGMLQDAVITMRDDRYCIPVKQEYKSNFAGMVHDQSSTGATLFIEPMAVVQLNNKIKELKIKEKREIEKILYELSMMVAEQNEILSSNIELLAQLDFIFAKAQLSISMNASKPIFNTKGYINIKKARHPLLDSKTVVTTDIYLGKDFDTLLITGPNTGGKTVTLKTIGLFTLMGQSGLHIPAFDNSELSVFDEVFADIGDEQSIEQSLSTFSSHMTNIVNILDNVTDNSLVLFDELGAGTDPTEGAALAIAILQYLHKRNIKTAVTTHYSELKVYALSTDRVENACCEFDVETLKPTYRLLIGIPGKSNAFAISKRLGLPDYIIEDAKEFISHEDIHFEDLITDIEISKKTVLLEQDRAEQYRREAESLKKEVEKQKLSIQAQKDKILIDARQEARKILQEAKDESDEIVRQLQKTAREVQLEIDQRGLDDKRQKLKQKLNKAEGDITNTVLSSKKKLKPISRNLTTGDRVYISLFNQTGIVLSEPDSSGEVMVQTGIMKIKVKVSDLALDETEENEIKQKNMVKTRVKAGKSLSISNEIDCRGQLVSEALENIDKYLDDAYLSGLEQVTIIHGKGTGALRTAVQQYLRKNPHVKSYRLGTYGEGEAGVTIVEIKK